MANYKKQFMNFLDSKGIKYVDKDEFVVKVSYNGKNLKNISSYTFFDDDGGSTVQVRCWEIANFKGKEAKGLIACNKANYTYRWLKFYLDKDMDVVASIDARLDPNSSAEECLEMVLRLINVIDEAYPMFAKALWA